MFFHALFQERKGTKMKYLDPYTSIPMFVKAQEVSWRHHLHSFGSGSDKCIEDIFFKIEQKSGPFCQIQVPSGILVESAMADVLYTLLDKA